MPFAVEKEEKEASQVGNMQCEGSKRYDLTA